MSYVLWSRWYLGQAARCSGVKDLKASGGSHGFPPSLGSKRSATCTIGGLGSRSPPHSNLSRLTHPQHFTKRSPPPFFFLRAEEVGLRVSWGGGGGGLLLQAMQAQAHALLPPPPAACGRRLLRV